MNRDKVLVPKTCIIRDWAGNSCFYGRSFPSFDAAEEFLCLHLGDNYETDRGEYYVERKYPAITKAEGETE